VGVFYGHPGVFVNPAHRAISIAKSEGYKARMLPGVSAEDCLFADLGIDPANPGCSSYEATDYLLRTRPANIHSHFVLWQVGCVGITDFNFKGFDNSKFSVLVDRLEQEYGADHTVVHYIAAILPYEDPLIDKLTISQLREPDVQKRINGISTFYIPPKGGLLTSLDVVERLDILNPGQALEQRLHVYPANQWTPSVSNSEAYRLSDQTAIAELESHIVPEQYSPLATSNAMVDIMTKLALDPKLLAEYKVDRHAFAQSVQDLTSDERKALETGTQSAIHFAMRNVPSSLAEEGHQNYPVTEFIVVPIWISINDMISPE